MLSSTVGGSPSSFRGSAGRVRILVRFSREKSLVDKASMRGSSEGARMFLFSLLLGKLSGARYFERSSFVMSFIEGVEAVWLGGMFAKEVVLGRALVDVAILVNLSLKGKVCVEVSRV
jgi:hypothetical protein